MLGVLVLVHELGHFAVAKSVGVRVERFSIGFGPKLWSIKKGETEYLLCAIPLGGYVKMGGDEPGENIKGEKWEFLSRNVFDRFKIIFAGPLVNYMLAFLIFSVIFMFGSPTMTTEVGALLKDYPAEKQGVLVGDKVLAIDGKAVKYWDDMTEMIYKHTDGPMKLSIERNGKMVEQEVIPTVRETKDIFGTKTKIALLGIRPSQKMESIKYGPLESFGKGFKKLIQLTAITYKALWSVITGKLSMKESMTGPIGIFIITGEVARLGFIYLLNFIAILSASLAIFNLLPFPVLDGGHILFLIIEKLRGKPVPLKTQEIIANVGISLLIMLTVFICYNDIIKYDVLGKLMKLFKR